MGWIQVGARDLTRWVEPVTRDTAKQRVAQGEEANQSNQAFQFPNSFCKHTGIEAHGCIRRLQPNKNLGELIISSRFWKMLPSVNLIPLPHGEGVLTHKEESVLFLNQRKRIKKKKKDTTATNLWMCDKNVTHECAKITEATQVIWSLSLGELILTLSMSEPFPVRLWSTSKGMAAAHNVSLHQCAGSTVWTRKEIDALAIIDWQILLAAKEKRWVPFCKIPE